MSTSLSEIEVTALLHIGLSAKLDPSHRGKLHRLIHLGLVDETPAGLRLTAEGKARYDVEAKRQGVPVKA